MADHTDFQGFLLMRVTRIAYSKKLNKGKYGELQDQAIQLGKIRTEIWQRYGSIAGVGLGDRAIRDQCLVA